MFFLRNSIISALIYFFMSSIALANDVDCSVDYKGFKSFIDGASPKTIVMIPERIHPPVKKDGKIIAGYLEHQVRLKDGAVVHLSIGGCAHYGYQLRVFNIKGLLYAKSMKQIMQRIDKIVEKLPVIDEKVLQSDWKKIRAYVENKIEKRYYKLDKETGEYVDSPRFSKQECPNYGDAKCGVVLGRDAFEIYSVYTP